MTQLIAKLDGDFSEALDRLAGEVARQVAFSGAAAMARVIYAEAKANTQGAGEAFPGVVSGALHGSIYWAKDDRATVPTYAISWNRKKAPHGHLVEFGHWRVNVVVKGEDGKFRATAERLETPVWVPAYPFLRPAAERMPLAIQAGLTRMRERFIEVAAK